MIDSGADFDETGAWRYRLWRRWRPEGRVVAFVGLNPSTADGRQDDPTIRRCIGFAKRWQFSALEVVNLFAWRATRPTDLKLATDPIGPENDDVLARVVSRSDLVVACWGVNGAWNGRDRAVLAWLSRPLHCLGRTRGGQPRHPLYLPGNREPELYDDKEP